MTLKHLPEHSKVIIDASKTRYIDFDVLELIKEFKTIQAPEKNIDCQLTGFKELYGVDNSYAVTSEPDRNEKIKSYHTPQYANT